MDWISTKERLPGMEEDVLISTRYDVYIEYLGVYKEQGNETMWKVSDNPAEGFYLEQVLAWMPLPKIYHERKGELRNERHKRDKSKSNVDK